MKKSRAKFKGTVSASIATNKTHKIPTPHFIFDVECRNADGQLKWEETHLHNRVTNQGLTCLLEWITGDAAGVPTAAYVVLNKANQTPAAAWSYTTNGDASNWDEYTEYSQSTRPAWTHGSISSNSVDNSASKASFSCTSTVTVYGAGIVFSTSNHANISVKDDEAATNGKLYSFVNFTSAKTVDNGDTLSITVTLTTADDGV